MTNSNRIKLTWISFLSYALTGALVIVTGMVMVIDPASFIDVIPYSSWRIDAAIVGNVHNIVITSSDEIARGIITRLQEKTGDFRVSSLITVSTFYICKNPPPAIHSDAMRLQPRHTVWVETKRHNYHVSWHHKFTALNRNRASAPLSVRFAKTST